jgi:hypothetical protein
MVHFLLHKNSVEWRLIEVVDFDLIGIRNDIVNTYTSHIPRDLAIRYGHETVSMKSVKIYVQIK